MNDEHRKLMIERTERAIYNVYCTLKSIQRDVIAGAVVDALGDVVSSETLAATEIERDAALECLRKLVDLYELKLTAPNTYAEKIKEKRAAWGAAKILLRKSSSDRKQEEVLAEQGGRPPVDRTLI